MRGFPLSGLLACLALVAPSFGATVSGRFGGRGARGGLSVGYHRQTSHSSLSIQFNTGSSYRACSESVYYGGAIGGGYRGPLGSGVYTYRGWVPYSPYLYQGYPGAYRNGVGPFTYTDAVIFRDVPGVQVFGYGERLGAPARGLDAGGGVGQKGAAGGPSVVGLIDRGDDHFVRGEFERAVEQYRAAARQAPDEPMAALALGHGLFATGGYAEAAAELRRAIRLYPATLGVRMNRRDFYGDPQLFDAHLARLARRVGEAPDDAPARFLLGYNYFFTQQYAKAREQFAAHPANDPEAQLFLRAIDRLE